METTAPRFFVFVLMPFAPELRDEYELGISPSCENVGAYCERVDDQIFDGSILQRIYNQISKADLIVAEMSGRNPNVFYEVGYAHALGKRVILLTREDKEIPFDLKHHSHIIHGGRITRIRDELEEKVRWFMENPSGNLAVAESGLEFYAGGRLLDDGAEIIGSVTEQMPERGGVASIQVDMHNPGPRPVQGDSIRLGLLFSEHFMDAWTNQHPIELPEDSPEGRFLLPMPNIDIDIWPGQWASVRMGIARKEHPPLKRGDVVPVTMRQFRVLGSRDWKLHLRLSRIDQER